MRSLLKPRLMIDRSSRWSRFWRGKPFYDGLTPPVAPVNANTRLRVRVREWERRSLRLFGGLAGRDVEYSFALRVLTGDPFHVLDIGSCDSLLPLRLAKMGHTVTVCDFRPYPERHPRIRTVQCDFFQNSFAASEFDAVTLISTIEHLGIGGYGMDVQPDADFRIMEEIKRVLRPDGTLVITTPFNEPEMELPEFERWYDRKRLAWLMQGWQLLEVSYWHPGWILFGRVWKFKPGTAEDAGTSYQRTSFQGFVCMTLTRSQGCRGRLIDGSEFPGFSGDLHVS